MNQKCLTTLFVPVQPLNLNVNPPAVCKNHQKPLSYYNKYKPNNEPICIDCLLDNTKIGNDSNLYIPVSNLEQEYYYQKNAFFQIIEQVNNMKKYDSHINDFKNLLINYFSQFIGNFLNEKIFGNLPQKKVEFCDKNNNSSLNISDILNLLYKVENEKFILENKSADVFCQLNKLQKTLLNNHVKLEKSFKDLLNAFFDNSKYELSVFQKEKTKEKIISKTTSNKRCNPNISVQQNSSIKSSDIFASTKYKSKAPFEEKISQFSPIDKSKENINDKKEISDFPYKININMEEEKIFEDNIIFDKNEINNSFSERKNSELGSDKNKEKNIENNKTENELEWRQKKNEIEEELKWRRKKSEEDDEICREHKDKINKLIEKDKNKKSNPINQSFYHKNKKNFKPKPNLNKSFQKYNPAKFNFSKKIEYKQYNQFLQKTCSKCGSSFITTKDEEICQNCKFISDDEERLNKRRQNKDFSKKNGKYGFFSKNYKKTIQSRFTNNKRFFGKKEISFNRNFANKSLIHSNSNFVNYHGKRMNSPKGFDEFKKYNNNNGKYNINKGKEKYENKYGKNNHVTKGAKKYYEKKIKDDFEVDLDTEEENNASNDDKNGIKEEKAFFKTTNDFFRNNSFKKSDDNIMNNNNQNISGCYDSEEKNSFDFNKNDDFCDEKEFDEKENNDDNSNDDNSIDDNKDGVENDDFETDF